MIHIKRKPELELERALIYVFYNIFVPPMIKNFDSKTLKEL
jgi:hypothetical protein